MTSTGKLNAGVMEFTARCDKCSKARQREHAALENNRDQPNP